MKKGENRLLKIGDFLEMNVFVVKFKLSFWPDKEEFVKTKRGFYKSQSRMKKNLSLFTGVSFFWIYKNIFTAHFSDLRIQEFSYFSHHVWAPITRIWRGILKNGKRIFSRTSSYTKTSLRFYKGVMVWEIQVYLYISFCRNSPYAVKWDSRPLVRFHMCQEEVSSQEDTWMFKEDIFSKHPQIFYLIWMYLML